MIDEELDEMEEQDEREEEVAYLETIVRLCEWLKAHGFSAEDSLNCIAYMAGKPELYPSKK